VLNVESPPKADVLLKRPYFHNNDERKLPQLKALSSTIRTDMNVKKALLWTNIFLLSSILVSSPVNAQEIPSATDPSLIPASGTLGGDCDFVTGIFKAHCIPAYLRYLIRLIFMFIGAFFLISVILAGYQIALGSITGGAGGKEAGIKKLQFAIIGLMISAFAFFIIDFFVSAIGPT